MRGYFSRMNPTLRGFLIIVAIVAIIVVLQLETTLFALLLLARIAFILAIAFFIYLMWRERRDDISVWPRRSYLAFYGAAVLAVAALAVYFVRGAHGLDAVAFLLILVICGFSMFRVWRDQHTYS